MISSMFMRVNSKCAHQVRSPLAPRPYVERGAQEPDGRYTCVGDLARRVSTSSVNVVASCGNHQDLILFDQVSRMHQVTTDDPTLNALSRAAEHVLVDKTTRRRFSPASSDSLLLTSAPLGWSGILVEQPRLPPAEMPEHSATGHAISVNVGTKPTSFAWSRGRGGWDDRPTNPGHCRILTYGGIQPVALASDLQRRDADHRPTICGRCCRGRAGRRSN